MATSRVGLPLLAIALLLAPSAHASTLPAGCPQDPAACTYARASLEVGPVTVTVEASVENGTAEEETVVMVRPRDEGTFQFSLLANASAEGEVLDVTIEMGEANGVAWTGSATQMLAYAPRAGFPEQVTFAFQLANELGPEPIPVPFTVRVENATGAAYLTMQVVAPQEARAPAPAPLLLVALAAALALILPRGRTER